MRAALVQRANPPQGRVVLHATRPRPGAKDRRDFRLAWKRCGALQELRHRLGRHSSFDDRLNELRGDLGEGGHLPLKLRCGNHLLNVRNQRLIKPICDDRVGARPLVN